MLIRSPFTTYSVRAHDNLLQQWQTVRYDEGPLQLDLTRAEFFDPYGMCGLVLFLNHLPPEALPVRLTLSGWPPPPRAPGERKPGHPQAKNRNGLEKPVSYLTRMDFWDTVAHLLRTGPNQIPMRPPWSTDRNVLLEVSILRSHDAISASLRRTGEILQNLNYTVPARGHILEVLSELCSNVLLHAQTEFGGVAAMQTYRSSNGKRYVVMSIGDAGIGVRRSLAANNALAGRLESDSQALGVAVQPGASRFASGGHGGGLPRVLEIARRYSGRVAFRSGTGALAYRGSDDERRCFETSPLPGTQLRISLPEATMLAPKS